MCLCTCDFKVVNNVTNCLFYCKWLYNLFTKNQEGEFVKK